MADATPSTPIPSRFRIDYRCALRLPFLPHPCEATGSKEWSPDGREVVLNLVRSLGLAAWALRSAASAVFRPRIWLPFFLLAGIQLAGLGLLLGFHRPALLPVGLPLVKALGGENATHYPGLYLYLPVLFTRVEMVLAVLVASLTGGVATIFFASHFGLETTGGAWHRVWRAAPKLIVLAAIPLAVLMALNELGRLVPQDLFITNAKVRWATRGASLLLVIVVQSLVVYCTAWVVLQGHRVWPALRDSCRVTLSTLMPTLILVAVPVALLFPLDFLAQRADLFASKLAPETMVAVVVGKIVLQIVLGFLLVGTITRLFVWRMEPAR